MVKNQRQGLREFKNYNIVLHILSPTRDCNNSFLGCAFFTRMKYIYFYTYNFLIMCIIIITNLYLILFIMYYMYNIYYYISGNLKFCCLLLIQFLFWSANGAHYNPKLFQKWNKNVGLQNLIQSQLRFCVYIRCGLLRFAFDADKILYSRCCIM